MLRTINANGTVRLDLNGPHFSVDGSIILGAGLDWGTPALKTTRLGARAGDGGEQQTSASLGNAVSTVPLILRANDGLYSTLWALHQAVAGEFLQFRNIIEWQADESVDPTRIYIFRSVPPPLRRGQNLAPHCLPGIDSAPMILTPERLPLVDGPSVVL